jgi:hypothetical protein
MNFENDLTRSVNCDRDFVPLHFVSVWIISHHDHFQWLLAALRFDFVAVIFQVDQMADLDIRFLRQITRAASIYLQMWFTLCNLFWFIDSAKYWFSSSLLQGLPTRDYRKAHVHVTSAR